MKSRRVIVALFAVALVVFGVLAFFSWRAKYARARTLDAVAIDEVIVMHQRVIGWRGPIAQDRLVAIDSWNGRELARTTVLKGELLGVRGTKAVYAVGSTLVLFDAATLESRPSPDGRRPSTPTQFGLVVGAGDSILLFDTGDDDTARVSSMTREGRERTWTTQLPWRGNDPKLVALFDDKVVIVDADGAASLYRRDGSIRWFRR